MTAPNTPTPPISNVQAAVAPVLAAVATSDYVLPLQQVVLDLETIAARYNISADDPGWVGVSLLDAVGDGLVPYYRRRDVYARVFDSAPRGSDFAAHVGLALAHVLQGWVERASRPAAGGGAAMDDFLQRARHVSVELRTASPPPCTLYSG